MRWIKTKTPPVAKCWDPAFVYVRSEATDISKTFARIRSEQAAPKVRSIKPPAKKQA